MNKDNCPNCEVSWDGGSILEHFKQERDKGESNYYANKTDEELETMVKESYGTVDARWKREIGIELAYDHPKHYDGVSYWQCPDCKTTFNRFTGDKEEIL